MMSYKRIALAAAAAFAGAVLPLAATATAQQPQVPQPQRTFNLSRAERTALQPLHHAVEQRNYAAA